MCVCVFFFFFFFFFEGNIVKGFVTKMSGFDLRFVIPVVINLLKSQTKAHTGDWDAFSLLHNPNEVSWIKISFHISLLVLFSCTSITFTRRPSPNTALICFQFGNFSPHIAVSFVCSLVFPQALFWFVYPAILIISHLILGWVNVQLSAFPVGTFQLSFSLTAQQVQANVRMDPQVPVPQVNIDIAEDTDDENLLL